MSLEEAIAVCTDLINFNLDEDTVPISSCRGRVAATNVIALGDVPPFDRSRVDGYAVTAQDFHDICSGSAADYEIIGVIAAGGSSVLKLRPGTAVRIMTGAPLPFGAAAVIKQEYAVTTGNKVQLTARLGQKTWCESCGSILKKGQEMNVAGEVLDESIMELLISSGVDKIRVFRRPRVCIISTGTELVMPGQPSSYGHIYNSNFSMLTAKLENEGCEVIQGRGDINDSLADISHEVQKAVNSADLVIITGGASEGDFDLVPAALIKTGCKILCGQLEMKPGTHTTIAAKGSVLVFNLPGNPGGGSILFEVIIAPVLRKLKGMRNFNRAWFNIRLSETYKNHNAVRLFCRGQLIDSINGLEAMPLKRAGRIKGIAPLVLDIAPGKGQKGDIAQALLV